MITLDVNLRVPNIGAAREDPERRSITNADSRFWKVMDVPALPKIGEDLELSCGGCAFQAVVKRVDWHDSRDRFVVACHYAKRSMTPAMYDSLRGDIDWTMRPLIAADQRGSL